MTEETFAVALSAQTAARIKWEMIADLINAVGGSINRRRSEQEKMPTELPPDYVEKVQRVFTEARQQFAHALKPLRWQLNVTLWFLLPSLALSTAAGAFLIGVNLPVAGGIGSTASLAALFGLLQRAWRLGKDQVILELIPQCYETLFALCSSAEEFRLVFNAMLDEFVALRKHLRG